MERNKRNIIIGVVGVAVIFGTATLFYQQYRKNHPEPTTPNPNGSINNNQNVHTASCANVVAESDSKVSIWKMLFSPLYTFNLLKNRNKN